MFKYMGGGITTFWSYQKQKVACLATVNNVSVAKRKTPFNSDPELIPYHYLKTFRHFMLFYFK